jgi:hypothetical protein
MAPSKNFLSRLLGSSHTVADVTAKQPKPPSPLQAVGSIMYRLHSLEPLGVEHELPQTLLEALTARLKFGLHVTQRTARVLVTLLLRTCVRHPLGEWAVSTKTAARMAAGPDPHSLLLPACSAAAWCWCWHGCRLDDPPGELRRSCQTLAMPQPPPTTPQHT